MNTVEGWRRKSYLLSMTSTVNQDGRMDGPLNVEMHHQRKMHVDAWITGLCQRAETREELAFAMVMLYLLKTSLKI